MSERRPAVATMPGGGQVYWRHGERPPAEILAAIPWADGELN